MSNAQHFGKKCGIMTMNQANNVSRGVCIIFDILDVNLKLAVTGNHGEIITVVSGLFHWIVSLACAITETGGYTKGRSFRIIKL